MADRRSAASVEGPVVHGREFYVEDPLDESIVWRVRYYDVSGRSYWSQFWRDPSGRLVSVHSMVEAAEDPTTREAP
jgi:hypothetical protein